MARPLIAPAMFDRLFSFYPVTVTIEEATEPRGTMGEFEPMWNNKIGYVDLDCRLSPADGKEIKQPDQTYVIATHVIAIAAYYPGIDEKDRAVVTSPLPRGIETFDILLVENDGQGNSTRLLAEIVT